MPKRKLTEEERSELQDALKRCPDGTFEAAIRYREEGDVSQLPAIVTGIVERYLEPEMRPKLHQGEDALLLADDLGVDSLNMMEIIMLVEETLDVSFDNQELRDIRTLGDVKTFMDRKIRGEEGASTPTGEVLPFEEILMAMPQQPPFLFVQNATVQQGEASGVYRISGEEFFLRGHFKDNPVFPASILIEALGQLCVLYLLKSDDEQLKGGIRPDSVFFTSCDGIRCHRVCRPGESLQLRIKPKRLRHPLATFEGWVKSKNEKVAFAESITLTFDYHPSAETSAPTDSAAEDQPERAHAQSGTINGVPYAMSPPNTDRRMQYDDR